ncbi:BTB/POZ domain-containing protein [Aspergillus affinis]|uniref:BTB/POZ domain-containing protein n=1 Tax=Aspergillus affinis TaxID=1070780 RepID=UPI0022FF0DBB|nr:uncharacterized protein KD926_002139 [Aspergillus affinis]KAI9036230.1 hypothetical protein KD926_002139 [Aspergillus affinis]
MTIVTKNREFKVHKVIVCGQSGAFSHALRNDWMEAKTATVDLAEDDPTTIEAMIHFMYGINYENSSSDHDRGFPMLFNIRVYQVGDKYDVPKLKSQARENFINALEKNSKIDDLPLAIADAYQKTVSTDRGLRDPILSTTLCHIDALLENESFKQVLQETSNFAVDLVQRQAQMTGMKVYRCPHYNQQ